MPVAAQHHLLLAGVVVEQDPRLISHRLGDAHAVVRAGVGDGRLRIAVAAPQPAPVESADRLPGPGDDVGARPVVQRKIDGVEAAQTEHLQPMRRAHVVGGHALHVAVAGHGATGADGAHDAGNQLQIAAPRRQRPRPASPGQRPLQQQADASHARGDLAVELGAVALALRHDHHRREPVAMLGPEAARRKAHVGDQVRVQQADDAARRPLGREVVDVGDLDVVDDGEILGRTAAPHDQVVALIGGHAHARQHLQHAADVAGRAGGPPDLLEVEAHRADRLLLHGGEVVRRDRDLLVQARDLVELHRQRRDAVRPHDHVVQDGRVVADQYDLYAVQSRRNASHCEAAIVAGKGGQSAIEDHGGGARQGLARRSGKHQPVDAAGPRRLLRVRRDDTGERSGGERHCGDERRPCSGGAAGAGPDEGSDRSHASTVGRGRQGT